MMESALFVRLFYIPKPKKLFGNCIAGFQPAVLVASSRQFARYLLEHSEKTDKFGGWKPPRQPPRWRRYVFSDFPNSF